MENLGKELCLGNDNTSYQIKQNIETLQNMNVNIANPMTVQGVVTIGNKVEIGNSRLTVTNGLVRGYFGGSLVGKTEVDILGKYCYDHNLIREARIFVKNYGVSPLTLSLQINLDGGEWYDVPSHTNIVIPNGGKKMIKLNELAGGVNMVFDHVPLTTNIDVRAVGILC